MALKQFNVTLDEKVVNRARKISEVYGYKILSPLLNSLLLEWCEKEESKEIKEKKFKEIE